jgi:hypothetical protein
LSKRQRRAREKQLRHSVLVESVRPRTIAAGSGLAVAASLVTGSVAMAASSFEVDTTADDAALTACTAADNDCSLRGAISRANADPSSTITFASTVTGTISLTSDLPTISAAETIQGPGTTRLTINEQKYQGVTADTTAGAVTISDLAIEGGKYDGLDSSGSNQLTLSGMHVAGSKYNGITASSPLTIEDSSIVHNGGLAGILTSPGPVPVVGVSASAGLTMRNSTVASNYNAASGYGIGVELSHGGVFESSTISSNRGSGTTTSGQGISSTGPYDVALRSTIVADNAGTAGGDVTVDSTGTLTENFSLVEYAGNLPTLVSGSGDNLNGQDPQLGPLRDNGGPTLTEKPSATSPVVDQGKDYVGTGVDQRGVALFDAPDIANSADGRDIGAVEVRAPAVTSVAADHADAGETVTIKGRDFTGATAVKFGSTDATSFTVQDDNTITAVVPSGSGTVDVTVTSALGTSDANAGDKFTYGPYVVDTTSNDASLDACTDADDDCSLSGAIDASNAFGGRKVTFAPNVTGTIAPDTSLPALAAGQTLQGPGADVLSIDASAVPTGLALDTTSLIVRVSGITVDGASGSAFDTTGGNAAYLTQVVAHGSDAGVTAGARTIIDGSTVSGNDVGIDVPPSSALTLLKSTVSDNTSYGLKLQSDANVLNSTIGYGGVGIEAASGTTANLTSTIVSGDSGSDIDAASATVNESFSLVEDENGFTVSSGSDNLNGQNPQLGPLADNGGPTKTRKPASTSPVVDQGTDAAGTDKDQRGHPIFDEPATANADDGRDIGAVELGPPTVSSLTPGHGDAGDTVTITGTGFTDASAVKFGSADATSFQVVDDYRITAVAPAGAGPVDVTVTTPDGTSATGPGDRFAYPATFVVDTTSDSAALNACTPADGDCSLRGAITDAEADPNSTITFAPGVTGDITLGSIDLPTLSAGEKVEGPGADVLAIDAGAVTTGLHADTSQYGVSISGLTVKRAPAAGIGAAPATHRLTVSDVAVINGQTDGIDADAPLLVTGTTLAGNAYGLSAGDADTTIRNTTVSGNTQSGVLMSSGGMVENSTISGNGSTHAGILASGDLTLRSTIVSGNSGGDVSAGAKLTENFSLIQDTTGLPALEPGSGDNLNGQDPQLGALASNGGHTPTLRPATTSPVLDKGKDFTGTGRDQRGFATFDDTRIADAADGRDIGAVELQEPKVTSLSTDRGNAGDTVTITGANFSGASAVKFGSADATSFHVVDATHITAVVPSGSGTVDVTVTGPEGTSVTSGADQFRYLRPPAVGSLSPTHGKAGDTVTITGSNLDGATGVKFGSAAATSVTVVDSSQLTAVVPAGSGTVDVTVTTGDGTSPAGAGDRFTYDQPTPVTPPKKHLTDRQVLTLMQRPLFKAHFVTKPKTLVFKDRLPEKGTGRYHLVLLKDRTHKRGDTRSVLGDLTAVHTGRARTVKVTIHLHGRGWRILKRNPTGQLVIHTGFKRKYNGHVIRTSRPIEPENRPGV